MYVKDVFMALGIVQNRVIRDASFKTTAAELEASGLSLEQLIEDHSTFKGGYYRVGDIAIKISKIENIELKNPWDSK